MAINWTGEQSRAINSDAHGILVAAAAGSGKTAVLVERIINIIRAGADVGEILVSTFTKAAAAGMREKIYKALVSEYAKNPADSRIRRQLTMVYGADIGTIHSFCAKLLRRCFSEAGVSPDFKLSSDDEARLMKSRVMSETLDELFEEGDADFLAAGGMFVRRSSDKRFSQLLISLYEKLIALPYYDSVIEAAKNAYSENTCADLSETAFGKELLLGLTKMARAYLEVYGAIACDYADNKVYAEIFSNECELLSSLCTDGLSWDRAYEFLSGISFPSYPRKKKDTDETLHYTYKCVRDELKEEINKLKSGAFSEKSAGWLSDLERSAPAIRGLSFSLRRFIKNYKSAKDAVNTLDFNDLEQLALSLLVKRDENGALSKTPLAEDISKRYREIFIDEYQDLNSIQELIFKAVSRKDGENLFMVGDVKQSIYGFRQANPRIFLKKYREFSKSETAEKNACILLSKNFRSRAGVLDAVNMVFSNIMSRYAGELDYGEEEYLYKNEVYTDSIGEYSPELLIIDSSSEEETGDDEENATSLEREAHLAASRILSIMDGECEIFDTKTGTLRPAKWGDFAVLLRSVSGRDTVFERVFSEYAIPVSAQSKEDFFKDPDVMLIMSILRAIDNPTLDIPLVSVMRSPIFGFCDDEIMDVRRTYPDGSVYDAVRRCAENGCKKCAGMLDYIEKARFLSGDMSVPEFLMYIYETTGVRALLSGLPRGKSRLLKLDTLYSVACEYEASHYSGLFNFILYVQYLIENNIEIQVGAGAPESADAVKIMSIHKSKGLEFPICIIADLGKKFNLTDLNEAVLFNESLGFGCDFFDLERLIVYPTIAKRALKERLRLRALSEEMRTLYVAMTRAQEKLIMIGTKRSLGKRFDLWRLTLARGEGYFTSGASSYLDFLIWGFKLYDMPALEAGREVKCELFGDGQLKFSVIENVYAQEARRICPPDAGERIAEPAKPDVSFVKERLFAEYKYAPYALMPSKLSATEAKGRLVEVEPPYEEPQYVKPARELKVPQFYKGATAGADMARERGVAMHLFMELVDYARCENEEMLKAQTDELTAMGKMSKEQTELIDYRMLMRFFRTELGRRMKAARALYREKRFFLNMDASEFYDVKKGASIMVQGVIDCFFEDADGKFVLIDFKTDKVRDARVLKERYSGQLLVYSRAVREVFSVQCHETYIYSFYSGELIAL